MELTAEKLSTESIKGTEQVAEYRSEMQKEASIMKLNSIHIKEEQLSIENKTRRFTVISYQRVKCFQFFSIKILLGFLNSLVGATKLHTSIDDEIYECIQEKETDTNPCFNISIQLTEAESVATEPVVEEIPAQTQNAAPEFIICNPVSIRPSQFPMNATNINETTVQGQCTTMLESLKDSDLGVTRSEPDTVAGQADTSVIVIDEDTEEMATACKSLSTVDRSRRETMHSPYKNHFSTNRKLNETINAVKDIDPFDMQLQNVFLDDIDFVEYIKSLENVHMTGRIRPIEVNADVQIGNETFEIVKQIGQGSFGFVFR